MRFKLFECCKVVRGYNRSIIQDLQTHNYNFIPNDLSDILLKFDGEDVENIKEYHENKYDDIIDSYFQFLFSNRYAFFTNYPNNFPKISSDFNIPSKISNAIITISIENNYFNKEFIDSLCSLGCFHIELRILDKLTPVQLHEILLSTQLSKLRSIDVVLPYLEDYTNIENLKIIREQDLRIVSLLIYSSPFYEFKKFDIGNQNPIIFTKNDFTELTNKKGINPMSFVSNMSLFNEAQHFNTFYNKKMFVDKLGNVKNNNKSTKSFGNIKEQSLNKVISENDFQKYWSIKKDLCDVCKDCEFRYMCIDDRIPLKRNKTEYFFSDECNYNPYINKWKGEKEYLPINDCGITSNEKEFEINSDKVNKINKKIWKK